MDLWLLRIINFSLFFPDYYGNILVKMENNFLFHSKINIRDAVKLHLWTNTLTKSALFWNSVNEINFVHVLGNGTPYVREYSIGLEVQSITFKTKEKCPFVMFHTNIHHVFYLLDKGESLSFWARIVYPENNGLYIIVEPYGPKLLREKYTVNYEIASGFCTKTLVSFYFKMSFDFSKCKSIMLTFFETDFPSRFSLEHVEKHTCFFKYIFC